MKKIFFGLSGGLGPAMRTLPIGKCLKDKGYEVAFNIFWESSVSFIVQEGYKHISDWDNIFPPADEFAFAASPSFWNLDHYHARFGYLDEEFTRTVFQERIKLLSEFKPDLVVADLSISTVVAAKYLKIPVVTLNQSCFHPLGKAMKWWSLPPQNLPNVTPVVNHVLTQLNLPEIKKMEDLNTGDIDLIPSFPAFDPIGNGEEYIRYVGPIQYTSSSKHSTLRLADSYILLYPGRLYDFSGDSGLQIVRHVLQACKGTEQKIVLALSEPLPSELKDLLSDHILVTEWFDDSLLEKASLFIHHGGHGSCMSALKNGVPSLIIPTISEREFNARQVHKLNLGDYLLPEVICTASLKEAIERTSKDAVILQGVQHWSNYINTNLIHPVSEMEKAIISLL